jgi:hypothetical protein
MKNLLLAVVILIAVSAFAHQQPALTARQYFVELRDANTFNKYSAKYVCFRDDEEPGFAVVSTTEDMVDAMNRNGDKVAAKAVAKAGDGLFVQTYFKGVANGEGDLYEKAGDGKYSLEFDVSAKRGRAKTVYLINWKTGRYRFQVYALDYDKNLPQVEVSGKCELIHPDDKPSVAGEKQ